MFLSHSAPFWVTSHGDCDYYIDTHNDGASMDNLCSFSQLPSQWFPIANIVLTETSCKVPSLVNYVKCSNYIQKCYSNTGKSRQVEVF